MVASRGLPGRRPFCWFRREVVRASHDADHHTLPLTHLNQALRSWSAATAASALTMMPSLGDSSVTKWNSYLQHFTYEESWWTRNLDEQDHRSRWLGCSACQITGVLLRDSKYAQLTSIVLKFCIFSETLENYWQIPCMTNSGGGKGRGKLAISESGMTRFLTKTNLLYIPDECDCWICDALPCNIRNVFCLKINLRYSSYLNTTDYCFSLRNAPPMGQNNHSV